MKPTTTTLTNAPITSASTRNTRSSLRRPWRLKASIQSLTLESIMLTLLALIALVGGTLNF
jgi:hypothetical protein